MESIRVKVAFVIDCTSSMADWIDAAKNKVAYIVEDVKTQYPNAEVNIGFVGYRDVHDKVPVIVIPMMTNVTKFLRNLNPILAEGGGDDAEDVSRGIQCAFEILNWNDAKVKMIFHIADAPNHGLSYHLSDVSDDYPGGIPYRDLLENLLYEISRNEIDYTFISINSTTDIMVSRMRHAYEWGHTRLTGSGFKTMHLPDLGEFGFYISDAINYSISTTIVDSNERPPTPIPVADDFILIS